MVEKSSGFSFLSRDKGNDLFSKGEKVSHQIFGYGEITCLKINDDLRQRVLGKFEQKGFN